MARLTDLFQKLRRAPRQRKLPYSIQGYGRAAWPLTIAWETLVALTALAWLAFYML